MPHPDAAATLWRSVNVAAGISETKSESAHHKDDHVQLRTSIRRITESLATAAVSARAVCSARPQLRHQ